MNEVIKIITGYVDNRFCTGWAKKLTHLFTVMMSITLNMSEKEWYFVIPRNSM